MPCCFLKCLVLNSQGCITTTLNICRRTINSDIFITFYYPENVYEHLFLTRSKLGQSRTPGYHTVSLRNIISAKSSPVIDCLLFSSTMPMDDITRSAGVEVACTERYFLANLKRQCIDEAKFSPPLNYLERRG